MVCCILKGCLAENGPSNAGNSISRLVNGKQHWQRKPAGHEGLSPQWRWDLARNRALLIRFPCYSQHLANLSQSSSPSSASSTSRSSSTARGDSLLATAPLPLLLVAGLCCVETAALSPTKSLPVQSVWHRGHFFAL